VWPLTIMLDMPLLKDLLGFLAVGEQHPVEPFRAKMSIKALDKGTRPRTTQNADQAIPVRPRVPTSLRSGWVIVFSIPLYITSGAS
jgi:hypothetical protein